MFLTAIAICTVSIACLKERERQTDRERQRQRETETERQTNTQTDREKKKKKSNLGETGHHCTWVTGHIGSKHFLHSKHHFCRFLSMFSIDVLPLTLLFKRVEKQHHQNTFYTRTSKHHIQTPCKFAKHYYLPARGSKHIKQYELINI